MATTATTCYAPPRVQIEASQTKKMPASRDQVVGFRGNCTIEHEIIYRVFLHNVVVSVWRLPLSNGCEFCDRIPYVLGT